MRLRKMKLAGFKSFVDPTTLNVPGDLTGIVGPNGCGKSNIIDAIMWVMGESSAKHLRGDAMTDVIFNGSSARKPVGQATVELIFDNSAGRVGGEYASYNEISVKRQLGRDGQSQYYLNGGRCRRRDITAIFLGTGLGPRSYSIIEQGMISRFIEAKPEELRSFIEEAAGISKYRERRRETELRIGHTKENISRLDDIREELGKQLDKLQRQARAAERYQELKKDERRLSAELLALDWQQFKARAEQEAADLRDKETAVEAARARLRQVETAMEQQRSDVSEASENLNQAQSVFYQVGADIAQLEQKLEHARERSATLEHDLQQLQQDRAGASRQLEQDQARLQQLNDQLGELTPQLEGSRSDSEQAYDLLNAAEQAMQSWQSEWDAFNEQLNEAVRAEENARTRLEHLELSVEDARHQRERLQQEQAQLNGADNSAVPALADSVTAAEADQQQASEQLEHKQQQLRELREQFDQQQRQLEHQRETHQELRSRLASLEAVQQIALGGDQEAVHDWLQAHGYADTTRLAQALKVEPDWTLALETVLGAHLQDLVVDDLGALANQLQQLPAGYLGAYRPQTGRSATSHADWQPLAEKIQAPGPLTGLLAGVYIASGSATAQRMQAQLAAHESVVTQAGLWFGPDWLRTPAVAEGQSGALSRENDIANLREQVSQSEQTLVALTAALEQQRDRQATTEQAIDDSRQQLQAAQNAVAAKRSEQAAATARAEQVQNRSQQLEDALQDLAEQIQNETTECESLRERLVQLQTQRDDLQSQRNELSALRDEHRTALDTARQRWQETHQESHGIALKLESTSSQRASLEQGVQRLQRQLEQHAGRNDELTRALTQTQAPLADMQKQLSAKLTEKQTAEQALKTVRERLQGLDETLRGLDEQRADADRQLDQAQQALESVRLAAQEVRVRLQTVEEQLQSGGHDLQTVLESLSAEASQTDWREQLAGIQRKIERLGPINLAAIDEHKQLSERKDYLDSQHADLTEALDTLEKAIRKIDRETRNRFKETFDQLNENLGTLFPDLFGGGHAYLELTGDDLLDTGVLVMARPPGKRNSSIHLLSGGEKALTAVAMVFSIFKLNPAPFCILDEVDAPLDDTNVSRFSDLVRKMSADVQFIVITHNKITMEITNQLIGVTMQEAGVSRLVSVDMDEAVAMAAAG
ncbi:MAG: chromosome segregation protein SMC [Gammaproteobacteria bacterium]